MQSPLSAAISILTWKTPKTLEKTLASMAPLHAVFSERIVVCQESDPAEIEIARHYGFTPIALAENVGIQAGIAKCMNAPQSDLVLVVENDCPYRGGEAGIERLLIAIRAIREGEADIVQMQRRGSTPGHRYRRYWGTTYPPRRTLKGWLRYPDAKAVSADAIVMDDFPVEGTRHIRRYDEGVYITRSDRRTWSNRPFLTSKNFFQETVLQFAYSHPTSRLINGSPDLEHAINSRRNRNWWRKSRFNIGIVQPGLFGHDRIGWPDGDDKNQDQ